MSHRYRDDIASYGHHPKQPPPNRLTPYRATFVAVVFITKFKLRGAARESVRDKLVARPLTKLLFLLFAALFSLGAVRLQNPTHYCPDPNEPPRRAQIINVYIHKDVGLVGVLLLLIILRQCYPSTIINITNVSGTGNSVCQRGL